MSQSQAKSSLVIFSQWLYIYIIKYVSYSFLTFAVGSVLAIVLVILTTLIGPNLSFGFLKYFSFINPALNQDNFNLDIDDIMQLYFFMTLILFLAVEIMRYLFKVVFNLQITLKFGKKLSINAFILTALFFVAILIIPQMKIAPGQDRAEFYFIEIIFYFVALITSSIYLTLNKIVEKLYSLLNN